MLEEEITIKNKLGLHTRAAAKLVTLSAQFESKIQIQHLGRLADCKSIMSVILLGVTRGVSVQLIITGADEFQARDAIIELINNRFGEAD